MALRTLHGLVHDDTRHVAGLEEGNANVRIIAPHDVLQMRSKLGGLPLRDGNLLLALFEWIGASNFTQFLYTRSEGWRLGTGVVPAMREKCLLVGNKPNDALQMCSKFGGLPVKQWSFHLAYFRTW
jgi:hypothetical protein